jgi:glycosyltransferase involved in cell wall biosynthesis
MLEAMASGLPVLATRHGGILEAVEHGTSGLLVEESDWQALAEAMRTLANNPQLYASVSHAGRAHVLSQFDRATQAATLESIYDEARRLFVGP